MKIKTNVKQKTKAKVSKTTFCPITTVTIKPVSIDEAMNTTGKVIIKSIEQITADFVAQNKKDFSSNANNYDNLFNVALRIIGTHESTPFSLFDFISEASYLLIDNFIVTQFFNSWIIALKKEDRVHEMLPEHSCYGYKIYNILK